MFNPLTSLLTWRRAFLTWLRSQSLLVKTLYMVSAVSLALWPLIDTIREADQLGIPQEQLIACLQRYPPSKEPQAFQRCIAAPEPVPFFLRHPPVTALVIAVLTAPLSVRSLRPRHGPTKPEDEDYAP